MVPNRFVFNSISHFAVDQWRAIKERKEGGSRAYFVDLSVVIEETRTCLLHYVHRHICSLQKHKDAEGCG